MNTVLFLCTGNYYRSRYAEILFRWMAPEAGLAWQATSRGLRLTGANPGPMSRYTIAALKQRGIPVDDDLRMPLAATADDFRQAQHIVAGGPHRAAERVKTESRRCVETARVRRWTVLAR